MTYLLTDRETPFQIDSGMILPDNPRPGDTVSIKWMGERKRDCPGTVYRKIVDAYGKIHLIEGVPAAYTPDMNPQPVVRQFRLPLGIAPGEATYYATTYFVCNWTQRWWPLVVARPPVKFDVAEPANPQGVPGVQGLEGPQGPPGAQGIPGARGPEGPMAGPDSQDITRGR